MTALTERASADRRLLCLDKVVSQETRAQTHSGNVIIVCGRHRDPPLSFRARPKRAGTERAKSVPVKRRCAFPSQEPQKSNRPSEYQRIAAVEVFVSV